ncbi:hypothetical protein C0Q70_07029 [Pomacea canaliculata]|uniref:Spondin-like TSP1 domain-containing protein n=1 Tax=Pomacea canaliculata TaxID=400727 RepID=A0A2T7PDW8_POMCA|nr:hypothetical protein C0Q70_07029 [Pomacea canaliculata]
MHAATASEPPHARSGGCNFIPLPGVVAYLVNESQRRVFFFDWAQDCTVFEWSDWTECDNPCGYGTRRRTRKVDTYPENGGKHCPTLKQRRACVGFDEEFCKQLNVEHQEEELQEVGRILPMEFGLYRSMKKFDPWKGILKNLYDRYFNQIFTRAT